MSNLIENNIIKAESDGIKKNIFGYIGEVLAILGLVLEVVGVYKYNTTGSINKEDPAFWIIAIGFFLIPIGLVMTFNWLKNRKSTEETILKESTRDRVNRLSQAALFAALAFVLFAYVKIDVPTPAGNTALHLGNTMVVLAALFLGGTWGGMAGAVGLTLADFLSGYVTSAPKTFLLKLCIGLIVGFVAHNVFKISEITDKKKLTIATVVSGGAGLLFNCVADPWVGYLYKLYLFGVPQDAAKTLAKMSAGVTFINAALSLVLASLVYIAARPILKRYDLLLDVK